MIEIVEWKENEDGSADVIFEMSEEEKEKFASIGILQCIKEGIKLSEGDTIDEL
jgi:hypothetical protein